MGEVKRFRPSNLLINEAIVHPMHIVEDGGYVFYIDYAILEDENTTLREQAQRDARELGEMQAEVDAIKAENAVLRKKAEAGAKLRKWLQHRDFAGMGLPVRLGEIYDYADLLAKYEQLVKAGDMCDQLLACFEAEGRKGVNIGRDMWRKAKEVQS